MFDLNGKIALVTGSSRGIGKAVAKKFAEAGATVIIHGRTSSDKLLNTAEELKKYKRDISAEHADTSKPEEINEMFSRIKEKYGRLDILVNNAAILSRAPFIELNYKEWDRIMQTNVRGYYLCSQCAAKLMIPQKWGRIINVSSISQFIAAPGRIHYCASKAAIGMLTKGMALELAEYGITANEVLPGSIHTDFNNDVLSDKDFYDNCVKGIPLGRLGKAEDIAGAVVMLASEEADYISGAEIVIDGGKTIF